MALITHMDVEVRPSIGFQTVGYTARVQFEQPLDVVDAIKEVTEVREALTLQAHTDLEVLVKQRQQAESSAAVTAASAAPVPQAGAPAAGGGGWRVANKPSGRGTFRYIDTQHLSIDEFKTKALTMLPGLGIDPEMVDVWDDRSGKYGVENGNEAYTPGKVKAKDGSALSQVMGDKSIVAGVEFNDDGSLRVALTKDGRAAVQAVKLAGSLNKSESTPF